MKNLLLLLGLLVSFFSVSQKISFDFTLNVPDEQFSKHVKPGIGFDVSFYLPAGKNYFELTPWSFFILNRERSDIVTGTRYTFLGAGAGYYQHLGPTGEWFLGANARAGLSEGGSNVDLLPGLEIMNINSQAPLKISLGGHYSPVNERFLLRFRFGYVLNQ